MNALLEHLRVSLRLHFRNRMALLYGYLFPVIFLVAFWVLYRHERVPLLRHMGELLTVGVLGGACFGLPTTLVSERERGVWRRYRLTPIPTWAVVTSTAIARYLLILSAGLLQLGLALALGMTMPEHPLGLFLAFTLVSFAFIGLGLVIATMADNVPAVQALGQCIFLPMLIIGGVAVPLTALPDWAQHISAFFPGRYAVESMQACVSGEGLGAARFSALALTIIGFAGCIAGAKLFRWDAQQRFAARAGKAWILPVLASWLAVGLLAEVRGRVKVKPEPAAAVAGTETSFPQPVSPDAPAPDSAPAKPATTPPGASAASGTAASLSAPPPPSLPLAPPPAAIAPRPEPPWTKVTEKDIEAIDYRNVPPDQGIVAPFADAEEEVADFMVEELDKLRKRLPTWDLGNDEDQLQAVRNLLCVAAVPDTIQLPIERYVPRIVYEHLKDSYPKDQLIKMLTWIIMNPERGIVLDEVNELGIEGQAGDPYQVRERMYLYAIKFVARLTGKVPE